MRRLRFLLFGLVCLQMFTIRDLKAQTDSYKQTNLVSDTPGTATNTDPKLVNPWGIAYFPGQSFWIADNNSGFTTLYNQNGTPQGQFPIPASGGSTNPSTPTGMVANVSGTGFNLNGRSSQFIFDSEDGAISAWNGVDPVTIMVDNSTIGAVYKGLALVDQGANGKFLLAANFNSGKIDIYDTNFKRAQLTNNFTDPNLPAGLAPFGVHVLNQQVFVTYAMQDQAKHDPIHQAGAGLVDVFDLNGGFVQRFASNGTLNAPWGAAVAPTGFGSLGGELLIGNFGDGTISAFDVATGTFIDQMKDHTGAVIANASLWDMVFGGGGASGDPNTLYFTAGLANEQHGLFAAITPDVVLPPGADFTLGVNPLTATVTAGQSTSFMVTVKGLNGFNSNVTFSCSGEPAGTTCSFAPATVVPTGTQSATTTLTLATQPAVNPNPYSRSSSLGGSAMTPFGIIAAAILPIVTFRRRLGLKSKSRVFKSGGLVLLLGGALLASAVGCGGSHSMSGTPRGTSTLMVTATSGSLSHSTSVSLTVQ